MLRGSRKESVKVSKRKTRLCTYVSSPEGCPFGENCAFAHSESELRKEEVENPHEQPEIASAGCNKKKDGKIESTPLLPLAKLRQPKEEGIKRQGSTVQSPSLWDTVSGEVGDNLFYGITTNKRVDPASSSFLHGSHVSHQSLNTPQLQLMKGNNLGFSSAHLPFYNINNLNRVNDVDSSGVWGTHPSDAVGDDSLQNYSTCLSHDRAREIPGANLTVPTSSPCSLLTTKPSLAPSFLPPPSSLHGTTSLNFSYPLSSLPQQFKEKVGSEPACKQLPPPLHRHQDHSTLGSAPCISSTASAMHPLQAAKVSWNPSTRSFGKGHALVSVGSSLLQGDSGMTPEFLHALPVPAILPSYVYAPSFFSASGGNHPGMVLMENSGKTRSTSSTSSSNQLGRGKGGESGEKNDFTVTGFQGSSSVTTAVLSDLHPALPKHSGDSSLEINGNHAASSFVPPFGNVSTSNISNSMDSDTTNMKAIPTNGAGKGSNYLLPNHSHRATGVTSLLHIPTTSSTSFGAADKKSSVVGIHFPDNLNHGGSTWSHNAELPADEPFSNPFSPYSAMSVQSSSLPSSKQSYPRYVASSAPTVHTTQPVDFSESAPSPQGLESGREGYSNLLQPSSRDGFSLPVDFYPYPRGWVSPNSSLTSVSPSPTGATVSMPFVEELDPTAEAPGNAPATLPDSSEPFYSNFLSNDAFSSQSGKETKGEQQIEKEESQESPCGGSTSISPSTRTAKKRITPCRFVLGSVVVKAKPKRRAIVNIQHESTCYGDIKDYPIENSDVEAYPFKPAAVLSSKKPT